MFNINPDFANGTATFVMPHWSSDHTISKKYLDENIESIFGQTDKNWWLIIIDDLSPSLEARDYLKELSNKYPDKIYVIFKSTNGGPGTARNLGVNWAYQNNSPLVLFIDADDVSHTRRLEISRKIFVEVPGVNVVYSSFNIIDQNSIPVPESEIAPDILEIIEGHRKNIVQGENSWIPIATEKIYTNSSSSTNVRTDLAYKCPFPPVRVSEDSHTWFRYAAHRGKFIFSPEIPSCYRIPKNSTSSARARINNFYELAATVDIDGFGEAMQIAIENGSFDPIHKDEIYIKFYIKLAENMAKANQFDISKQQIKKAAEISKAKTAQFMAEKGLQNNPWAQV